MKKLIPLLALLAGLALVAKSLMPPKNASAFDVVGFGHLPVLANGRIKPLDTVARSSLLQLQGRQEVRAIHVEDPLVSSPGEWLLDVCFRPEKADKYPTFVIDDPEVRLLIGRTPESLRIKYDSAFLRALSYADFVPSTYRRFSFEEIAPHLQAIEEQAKLASPIDESQRTPFQRELMQLYNNLHLYLQLRYALAAPDRADFLGDLLHLQQTLPAGMTAVRAKQAGQAYDEAALSGIIETGERFDTMSRMSSLLVAPPDSDDTDFSHWQSSGAALLTTFQTGQVNSASLAYAGFGRAWRDDKPAEFNQLLTLFRNSLARRFQPQLAKADAEARFNAAQPFYTSTLLFFAVSLTGIFSWIFWRRELQRASFWLMALAWTVATVGIITRMALEGRPPVTNLYSSALWVGWGATTLCLFLEYIFPRAIASVAAGAIGYVTLVIAHHLSLSGDTLEMMRAVLDTNLWLATHVVIVVLGYAATFLAGVLALIYIVRSFIPRALDRPTADALSRMVYGIVCFATLFSFVGTVLGGIWADQSWGRFWGWDPKENGALIIVIWNAIILHARWGGIVKQRGLMCLAIFGNIVTAWSWFGVNMLGVGLHSYGFTQSAFVWLIEFALFNAGVIVVANLPLHRWLGFPQQPEPAAAAAPAARKSRETTSV